MVVVVVVILIGATLAFVALAPRSNSSVSSSTTSTSPSSSQTSESSTSSSSTTTTHYSTTSPASGLQLQIALNATTVEEGSPLSAQISLFNTLLVGLPLRANYSANPNIANWDLYDYLCGLSFSVEDVLGFAMFQGSYASGNLSQAGAPMLLTPPMATSCPNRFYDQAYVQSVEFAPESYLATLSANASFSDVFKPQSADMQVNAVTGSCSASPYNATGYSSEGGVTTTFSGIQYSVSCGPSGGGSLYGYWTRPAGGDGYVSIDGSSNGTVTAGLKLMQSYFHQFAPGVYTIVAEDMWNQTVFAHFRVVAAAPTTGSTGAAPLFTVTFEQAGTCSPTLYAPEWSVTLGNESESAQTNDTSANAEYAEPLAPPYIVFYVPDGVYQYSVGPPGDGFQPASGTVTVSGTDVVVTVSGPVTSCTMVATS
jgi:hypothetical protein